MTPKIPLRLCKKCPLYHGNCPLQDLDPCIMTKDRQEEGAVARIVVIVLLVAVAAVILFLSCQRDQAETSVDQVGTKSVVELLRQQHKGELSEYDKLILAIAFTESRWNPDAVGKNGDIGFLQITPVYVREANRVSGANFKHEDAFSIDSSLAMFQALQSAYNPTKDIHLGIYFHNKSAAYERAVLENLKLIERYENLRAKLVELHDK